MHILTEMHANGTQITLRFNLHKSTSSSWVFITTLSRLVALSMQTFLKETNHPPTINMIRPSGLLCHSLKAPSTTAVYLGSDNFRAFQCSREQNDGPCLVRGTGISMIGGGWGHSCTKSVFRACTVSWKKNNQVLQHGLNLTHGLISDPPIRTAYTCQPTWDRIGVTTWTWKL